MITYLGMKFKNAAEIKEFNKQGNVNHYKTLAKLFVNNPTTELSSMMSNIADTLVNVFGMTYAEIEAIEIEAFTA